MNRKKSDLFILILLFSAIISPADSSMELSRGSLGLVLSYVVESPIELKVGANTPINFTFINTGNKVIFVHGIWIWIYGSGISTDYGISELVIKDAELHPLQSVNKTIMVRALKEGIVSLDIHAEYDFIDFYGNSRYEHEVDVIFIHARVLTLNDLKDIINALRNIVYALSIISIGLVIIVVYVLRKTKKATFKMLSHVYEYSLNV